MTDIDQHEATPRSELERQIMDHNIPKNEREWWAAAEIERLRANDDIKLILQNQHAMMNWMVLTGMTPTIDLRAQIGDTRARLDACKTVQQDAQSDGTGTRPEQL